MKESKGKKRAEKPKAIAAQPSRKGPIAAPLKTIRPGR